MTTVSKLIDDHLVIRISQDELTRVGVLSGAPGLEGSLELWIAHKLKDNGFNLQQHITVLFETKTREFIYSQPIRIMPRVDPMEGQGPKHPGLRIFWMVGTLAWVGFKLVFLLPWEWLFPHGFWRKR